MSADAPTRTRSRRLGPRPAARRRRRRSRRRRHERCSPRRSAARTRSPPPTRARSPSSTARASSPRCASSRRSRSCSAAPARTRCSTSPATPPTRRAARCCRRCRRAATAIETTLLFFELEWAALDDERAEELLAADGLDFARHHLRTARRYRPHLLSEPEEKILAEKALTGRTAWTRLFEEQASAITVDLDEGDEPVSLEVALSRLFARRPRGPPRRRRARHRRARSPGLRTRAYVLNTLLADKAVDDRLRNYPHWLASRNLANEASDESVEALIAAVRDRYELPRRWYRLKAQLLGVDRLADYDRMAAVTDAEERVDVAARRATSCSTPTPRSRTSSARSCSASSTSRGSTRRCARTSAAARSAPTPCRRRTRTCCSTTRTRAATC